MAPPWTLILSRVIPKCRIEGKTWAAKASLISTRSISLMVIPARDMARRHASTGPRPMISGFNAVTAEDTIRASGVIPSSRARTSLITTTAAAPSFSGQAFPAVTEPSVRNTGLSFPNPSRSVCGRGPSSAATTVPLGSVMGVMSFSKNPLAMARPAFCCDCMAYSSCAARVMPSSCATFSAVWPMEIYTSANSSPGIHGAT